MTKLRDWPRRLLVTICLLTGTTELAARWLGTRFFLPALFVWRYANMGGLAPERFAAQMDDIRSFRDDAWCGYWNAIAERELAAAERALPRLARLVTGRQEPASREQYDQALAEVHTLLAPLGGTIAERLTSDAPDADAPADSQEQQAITALRHVVKAITYYQVSAFPGDTPERMKAYAFSRKLFHPLTEIVGPVLGITVEPHRIEVDGDVVEGYLALPAGNDACPLVIVSNGLEGTVQELAIPLLRYHDSGMAVFVMEMPGAYAYKRPMSDASEAIYHRVINSLSRHPRVNPNRIGFVGVSFGGYWAARMAMTSKRLRCAIACGAPTHRTFQGKGAIGTPRIIVRALLKVTGASGPIDLSRRLRQLSLGDAYQRIGIPLLVINGDDDTLLGTEDSVDLAVGAPRGELKLYPNDDHCAMKHYREWLDFSQDWLWRQLMGTERSGSAEPQAKTTIRHRGIQ